MNDQKECNGDEQRRNTLICAYSKVISECGYKIGDKSNSRQIVLHVIKNMNKMVVNISMKKQLIECINSLLCNQRTIDKYLEDIKNFKGENQVINKYANDHLKYLVNFILCAVLYILHICT